MCLRELCESGNRLVFQGTLSGGRETIRGRHGGRVGPLTLSPDRYSVVSIFCLGSRLFVLGPVPPKAVPSVFRRGDRGRENTVPGDWVEHTTVVFRYLEVH